MAETDLRRLQIDRTGGAAPRRRWRWRIVIALAIAAGAAGWAWNRQHAPIPVTLATVASAWPSLNYTVLNATGYVVPQRKAALASKATGRLEWLGVLEGSRVKSGEVVARLESLDVRAGLDQAAAQVRVAQANLQQGLAELNDAEASFRRSAELLAKRYISAAQHDANQARLGKAQASIAALRAAVGAAEAARRNAEVAVEQTRIRAPFDGVVLTKNANVGDNITPFSSAADSKGAVVTIADMDTLEVEADVSESAIAKLRADQPCEVQLDALPGLRLAAVVSRTVPTVDRSKATVLVKIRFVERDPRVLPEMSAKVAFLERAVPAGERQAVTAVQPGAVVEREGRKLVFVAREGRAHAVPVQTGGKVGELVQVSGIEPGARVVLDPGPKVRDGVALAAEKP